MFRIVQTRISPCYQFIRGVKSCISPPDRVSNLRRTKYILNDNASALERKLCAQREQLDDWNQNFWTEHNNLFRKEMTGNKHTDIAVFSKRFLDDHWQKHVNYNFMWYRKHVGVTWLHFRVTIQQLISRLGRR